MRHRLFIPAATALLIALTACTQDELADDNRLPEGEYPVVIRATGLSVEATPHGCRRIQERHALTHGRPALLDQPRPDYRIGMVAHRQG